nr:hypothetical protein [Tanacetum cinerariifolium]
MVNMVPREAFACSCAEGDVVLRQSYKPESCELISSLFNSLRNILDVDFFMERDPTSSIDESPGAPSAGPSIPPSYSPGPSTPSNYSSGSLKKCRVLKLQALA